MKWMPLLIVIPLLPVAGAWKSWRSQTVIRNRVFFIALLAASVAVAQWIAFSVYTVHIGGWGENMSGAALWFRVGFWTSLAALILCAAGRGASRALGMASALLQAGLWMLMISGM
jgi:hypothetical protein